MRAFELSDEEKKEYWPMIVAAYSGYENYQKVTERSIPVFVCRKI